MPAASHLDIPARVVLTTGTGVLNVSVLNGHMDWLSAQPGFQPDFGQVVDLTPLDHVELHSEDIRQLSLRTVFGPESRRAVIVATPLQYGLARMYASLRAMEGEPNIRVYHDLEEAVEWVGISAATARHHLEILQARLHGRA